MKHLSAVERICALDPDTENPRAKGAFDAEIRCLFEDFLEAVFLAFFTFLLGPCYYCKIGNLQWLELELRHLSKLN